MDWFRSYHGAPTDAKWIVIAAKAQSKPGVVAAVWWYLMDMASQATDRGSVASFDAEVCAASYGFPEEEIARVYDALLSKGLISPDRILTAWLKRNHTDYSTERVRRFRNERNAMKRSETVGNAGNAEEKREEEIEEKKGKQSGDKRPKRGGWVVPYCDAWIDRFGGTAHGGRIGKALKPLHEKHGQEAVMAAWKRYLDSEEPEFAAPESFAAKYGIWSNGVPPKLNPDADVQDVKLLIKAAGTRVFNAFTREDGFKAMANDYPAAWRRLEPVMRKIRYGDLKDAAEQRNGIEYTNLLKAQLREISDAAA